MRESMSPSGCNCYIRAMNSYCSYLSENGSPPLRMRLLRTPASPVETFSDPEVRDVLGLKNRRLRVLCALLLDTGIRNIDARDEFCRASRAVALERKKPSRECPECQQKPAMFG